MAIKKVVHRGDVLIDLSESTIAPETVLAGEIGFNSKGERFEGTMLPGSNSTTVQAGVYKLSGYEGLQNEQLIKGIIDGYTHSYTGETYQNVYFDKITSDGVGLNFYEGTERVASVDLMNFHINGGTITIIQQCTVSEEFATWWNANTEFTPTVPEGFIKPQGQIVITNTNITDVTEYASAVVQDANLRAENIKKDVVILGIQGTLEAGADEEAITSAILSREW